MSGDIRDVSGRLGNLAEELGVALGHWGMRGEVRDKAAARRAGSRGVDLMHQMTAQLYQARQQLVTEIRADDDAAATGPGELLARYRKEDGR